MLTTEFHRAKDAQSRRLMIVLHGLGDSSAGYRWLPAEMNWPWMNYLLVNAPDDYYGGFSWYPIDEDPAAGIERSRNLLFKLLEHQRAEGWLTEETTLFGFSQGCLMVWEMGLRYPRRFAGLVGISGYVQDVEDALRHLSPVAMQQRFLITHGTQDPLIPFATVRPQVERVRAAGLNVTWRAFDKQHTIAGFEEVDLIRKFVADGYVNKQSPIS